MSEVGERMGRLEDAMTDLMKAVNQASQTADRASAAVDRTTATVDRTSQNVDRAIVESRRAWGEMANKMGTLVEDIVAPGLPEILQQQLGFKALEFSARNVRRSHRHDRGRMREFDFVAMAGDLVLVNETKSKLRPEYIAQFLEALRDIRNYLPEAEGRQVIGCLAAFSADPSLVTAGERHGLLMLGLGTGLLRVLNSPGFVPRKF